MRESVAYAGLLFLAGCSDSCSNMVVSSLDAPDGRHSAALFQRDCGATTSYSTQISVLAPGEQPSGSGNTLVADDDHGAARTGEWSGPWAEVKWLASDHLLIRYATKSRIFERHAE